ncbi:L-aspartate oxidase [Halolactibacillus alkaliphilus]|uniref:L-aspartate oxidase n=1 Tax=Halolactibacillus alkaliphilus TaxID=442899 RepID=A0A511X4Q8_9BACI|nr:L-aspartate oxidase [Halolactibacillus alkaliphilus]GEN57934.1 L-aspartate oxidase [Halolactibacillus alkaliphilus]GGN75880.1 L-aspartate oxidase [Halolactibacillus alkaliphilus]SFP09058.1 L-aspartate oxidase [Halolactibacillus alkaliphilus]
MKRKQLIIIGTGLSACQLAYNLLNDYDVIMLSKGDKQTGNTVKAQGGIACVMDQHDHLDSHIHDTLMAGSFLNDVARVEKLIKKAPNVMQSLIQSGFLFDQVDGQFMLGKEGAHQHRRILHAGGDQTGKRLICHYHQLLQDKVTIIEQATAVDILKREGRCIGVRTVNHYLERQDYFADAVVLATGGYAGIFQYHSNDPLMTGDGVAMGYRAGAAVNDLEFIQFHPTLAIGDQQRFLISEAVRGEGARLVNGRGEYIMDHHPLKDLAPRDVVSQVLYVLNQQDEATYLDIRPVKDFERRFPQITDLLHKNGIDIKQGLIPVQPGAHFTMGGLAVNEQHETTVPNLYAIGEVAATGVHGANRLASNSLLEALVFGKDLADVLRNKPPMLPGYVLENLPTKVQPLDMSIEALKKANETYLGVVRSQTTLKLFEKELQALTITAHGPIYHPAKTLDRYTSENMLLVSQLVLQAALNRKESIGAHKLTNKDKQAVRQ